MEQWDEMQAELHRLRRENERLRQKLRKYQKRHTRDAEQKSSKKEHGQNKAIEDELPLRLAAQAVRRYRLFEGRSYPRYLWVSFRETDFYQRIRDFWINFRRYRLISRCVTVAAALFTIMGTSAVMLLTAAICLLFIPAALLLAGGTTLLGLFRRKEQNAQLRAEVEGQTVYLFFPASFHVSSFAKGMLRELAGRPQSAVFVISPYSWSTRGLGGHGFYVNARKEGSHLFLLRRHYFFFFRRLLNSEESKRIVVIL